VGDGRRFTLGRSVAIDTTQLYVDEIEVNVAAALECASEAHGAQASPELTTLADDLETV
jgi:hypothetical protein